MAAFSGAAFAEALFDPERAAPDGLTTARGQADAARFAVYRNNVTVSLTKALEQRFPVCLQLVGDEFFAMLARAFIALEKPATPMIFAYGDGLPDFVEAFAPADPVPYLADVARIERAWSSAYHAADVAPLAIADLADIEPARMGDLKLMPHPAAALVRSRYPAGSIWAAHQTQELQPLRSRDAETVLVVRPHMEVGVHVLPPQDAIFAEALLAGEPAAVAAEAAIASDARFDFGQAFIGLIGLGAFATFQRSPERS